MAISTNPKPTIYIVTCIRIYGPRPWGNETDLDVALYMMLWTKYDIVFYICRVFYMIVSEIPVLYIYLYQDLAGVSQGVAN